MVSHKLLKIIQKKVTTNECRQVEVPVCTKEPSTVSKEVCRDIPREVITDVSLFDKEVIFILPGLFGRDTAHMQSSEEARVQERLPRRLPGYLLVQSLRLGQTFGKRSYENPTKRLVGCIEY